MAILPIDALVRQSCIIPNQIRLWRSFHSQDTCSSSWYWSYMGYCEVWGCVWMVTMTHRHCIWKGLVCHSIYFTHKVHCRSFAFQGIDSEVIRYFKCKSSFECFKADWKEFHSKKKIDSLVPMCRRASPFTPPNSPDILDQIHCWKPCCNSHVLRMIGLICWN